MMLVFSQYYLIDGFPVDYRSLNVAEQNRVIESNAQLKMLTASIGCKVHPGELVEVHTGFEQGLLYNTLYVCCHTFRRTLETALKPSAYPIDVQIPRARA